MWKPRQDNKGSCFAILTWPYWGDTWSLNIKNRNVLHSCQSHQLLQESAVNDVLIDWLSVFSLISRSDTVEPACPALCTSSVKFIEKCVIASSRKCLVSLVTVQDAQFLLTLPVPVVMTCSVIILIMLKGYLAEHIKSIPHMWAKIHLKFYDLHALYLFRFCKVLNLSQTIWQW